MEKAHFDLPLWDKSDQDQKGDLFQKEINGLPYPTYNAQTRSYLLLAELLWYKGLE